MRKPRTGWSKKMTKQSSDYKPYAELGSRLRELRLLAGIPTQKLLLDQLSEKGIAYTEGFWSKVENGRRRPAREHLLQVLKLFREQGASLDIISVQDIFRLAGYASLDGRELSQLFQVHETDLWNESHQRGSLQPLPTPVFHYSFNTFVRKHWPKLSLLLWFLYLEILELWRNLGWRLYHSPDLNWWGLLFPIVATVMLYWQRRLLQDRLIQIASTVGLALLSGIMMVLTVHRVGIIIPVLSTLGGITIASLDVLREKAFLPNVQSEISLKVLVELSLGAIALLILVGVAMNLILFTAPPGAFGQMPYELRVFRGIEILLALLMILGLWILFWLIPLFDMVSVSPSVNSPSNS